MAEAVHCNFHSQLLALALEINLLDRTLLYWKWPSSFLTSLEGMMNKRNNREACSILHMLTLWIWLIVVGFVIFFVLQGVIYCLLFKRLLWTIQSMAFLLDPSAVFAGNLQLTLVVVDKDWEPPIFFTQEYCGKVWQFPEDSLKKNVEVVQWKLSHNVLLGAC